MRDIIVGEPPRPRGEFYAVCVAAAVIAVACAWGLVRLAPVVAESGCICAEGPP